MNHSEISHQIPPLQCLVHADRQQSYRSLAKKEVGALGVALAFIQQLAPE